MVGGGREGLEEFSETVVSGSDLLVVHQGLKGCKPGRIKGAVSQ